MILAQYEHRLPASHDTARERVLAIARSAVWDDYPHLYFKAFLLRERGRYGSTENRYSLLYLWEHDSAFSDFLVSEQYQLVQDIYGRARIQTWAGVDARRGASTNARFAHLEERDIPQDAQIAVECAAEIEWSRSLAEDPGTVAVAVGIDPYRWRIRRVLFTEQEPAGDEPGTCHQVFHLAHPLLGTLVSGGDR